MKSEVVDYQRVVEALRDLRASNVLILTEEVRRYATDYAALCRAANDRLRQCSTLLQQGFRSEAIHLAEEAPNLLDLVAALDLPEPEIWAEFCQQHELPVPPPLQLDRASQLNDAYEQEQPLKALLAKHRRLALGRAPVKRRLDVMRQIYDLDPSATFWEADLRLFERARFGELTTAFHAAMKSRDIRGVQKIADEMSQTPWLETPPEPLKSSVEQTSQQIQQAMALIELRKTLGPLREAFAARQLDSCRTLLQQCRDLLSLNSQMQVPNEIVSEIQPVSEWVKREDQLAARRGEIEQACQRLTGALRADLTDSELAEAYEGLRAISTVPPGLDEEYRQRLESRARERQRSRYKKLALIGTLVVVLSGIGGLVAHQFLQSSAISDWTRRIRGAVEARNVELARHLVKEQERQAPGLNSAAPLAAVKKEASVLEDRFNRDTQSLDALLASLRKSADAASAAADAAEILPGELVQAASGAADALARAKQSPDLSWVDRELKIKGIIARLESLQAALVQKINSTVAARLDELSRAFDSLNPGRTPVELDASATKVSEAMEKARTLQRITGIDETTRTAAENFLKNAQQWLTTIQAMREQLAAIKAIEEKATSADAIATMLQEFASKYPDAPISAEFTAAAPRAKSGKALEAWRELAGGWGGKPNPGGGAAAQKRAEAVDAYLKAHPASPLLPQVTAYHEYLKQASEALSEKGPWQSNFSELLASPLLTDIQYVDASNGKRYWILGEFKKKDRRIGDRGAIEMEVIDPKNLTKRVTITLQAPIRLLNEKPIAAPHTAVAQEMASQIKLIDESNWATWGIDYTEKLARQAEMDPVVKAILMQQVLKTTRQVAGWGVGDLYDKALRDLARHDLENVCWYNPDQPVPASVKASIQKVMEGIPAPATARALLRTKEAEFASLLGFTYSGSGILLRDFAGAWRIHAAGDFGEGCNAYVIRPGPPDPNLAPFVPIAQYKNNQFVIMESAVQGLPQGTMVFVRKP